MNFMGDFVCLKHGAISIQQLLGKGLANGYYI
ncbi:MAG: hypothetical protein H6Q14_2648 [Bacteroidetes bacterium]|jgi:hypothetical protein|nr:hypothetical protein [Bacteroidota bacterium]